MARFGQICLHEIQVDFKSYLAKQSYVVFPYTRLDYQQI